MANTTRISSKLYNKNSNSINFNFLPRKFSPFNLTLYIILLFGLSISIFFLYSKDVLDDEETSLVSDDSQSGSHHIRPYQQVVDKYLWVSTFSRSLRPCVKPSAIYEAASLDYDRYITVKCNGGLNQMRTGIADMVAVARIMNATLVIPQLDKRSFWQDSSGFADIFDELHFIKSLQRDVRIVKELPKHLESVPRARKHFGLWSGMSYYENMTQLWKDYQVIHVAKSDSRLANNDLPLDIQRLRCRALYRALRFSPPIELLGKIAMTGESLLPWHRMIEVTSFNDFPPNELEKLVISWLRELLVLSVTPQRLVERLRSRGGKYIALHLRYEKDMLSFTGCTYGLSNAESEELRIMREKTNHWKVKKIDSMEQRNAGLCPLTPKEVGIFIQALGYSSSTLIYIAAGEIYGGARRLSDLTVRFPNVVFKETLATKDELKAFSGHASQSAAIDYIISVESNVFIPSHSGNMARAVEGHRRFLGHRKTITPDRKGLIEVFDKFESGQLDEASVSEIVKRMHKKRQGAPRRRSGPPTGIKGRARLRFEESFYQNPFPDCICNSQVPGATKQILSER